MQCRIVHLLFIAIIVPDLLKMECSLRHLKNKNRFPHGFQSVLNTSNTLGHWAFWLFASHYRESKVI